MGDMVKNPVLSFPVFFEKVTDYSVNDDRFTRVKIWLMHTGLNYNNSIFEKSVVEDAISSLGYIPIVGFIEESLLGDKDFTTHKYVLTKKDGNGVVRKYIGNGYGVVLSNNDNNAHFEMRKCDDGVEREFLVVDGIIWNMFEDSSEIINRDIIKNHSMELHEPSVDGYEDEDGYFHFKKFSFRAACILGNNVEPAMINSTVEVQFTMSDFVKNIQSELNDKYTTFSNILCNTKNKEKEGGQKDMPNTNFAQTVMQQFEDISNIVRQYELVKDRWGEAIPRYYAVDIHGDEVIVVDRANNYNYYGFSFSMNGDKANIDFSKGCRKKLSYENYEDGSTISQGSFDFGEHISKIEETAFQKVADAEAKVSEAEIKAANAETEYSSIKADYEKIKPKYDEYVKTEQKQHEDAINAEKDAMFAKFEDDLSDNTEFSALKNKKSEMTVEEIEKECSVLFARNMKSKDSNNSHSTDFSKNNSVKVGVMDDVSGNDNDVHFVPTKYGNIPVRR